MFYYCKHCEIYWDRGDVYEVLAFEREPYVRGDVRSIHTTTHTDYVCPQCGRYCSSIDTATCDTCFSIVPVTALCPGTDTCETCIQSDEEQKHYGRSPIQTKREERQ